MSRKGFSEKVYEDQIYRDGQAIRELHHEVTRLHDRLKEEREHYAALVAAAEKIVKQPWVGTSVAQIHRDLRTALDALEEKV